MAAPSVKFSQRIADEILNRLAGGMSLLRIRELPGMPDRRIVHKWIRTNPKFQQAYAEARAFWADCVFEDILELCDDASGDWKVVDGQKIPDRVAVDRARLRIDTRKWALARISPHKYAERVELTGAEGTPLNPPKADSDYEMVKGLAFLLAEGAAKEAKQQPGELRITALLPAPPEAVRVVEKPQRVADPRFTESKSAVAVADDSAKPPADADQLPWLRHQGWRDEQGLQSATPKVVRRR